MAVTSIALPLLGLGGLFLIAAGKKEPAPGVVPGAPALPRFPGEVPSVPGDLRAYIEVRQMPEGPIQYFRQDMVPRLMGMLQQSTVRPASPPGGVPMTGQVSFYEVLPWQAGAPRASDAVALAQKSGFIVLGSLSLPVPTVGGRVLAIMKPDLRRAATAGAPWAVLLDALGAAPGPVVPGAPGVPGAPAVPPVPGVPGVPGAPGAPVLPGMLPGFPAVPGMPGVPGMAPGIPGMPGMPPGGVVPGYPGAEPWAAGMPPELASEVRQALGDSTMEPQALEQMADALDTKYPAAAAALRARALELRTQRQLGDAARGGSEFTIRGGDTGSYLAKYYTGNGNRWREIPGVNPGMRTVTVAGVTQLVPWQVGDKILLPLDWKIWEKPLPPTQTGTFVAGTEDEQAQEVDPIDPGDADDAEE